MVTLVEIRASTRAGASVLISAGAPPTLISNLNVLGLVSRRTSDVDGVDTARLAVPQ